MKNNLFLYVLFIVLAACSKDNDKFQLSTDEREFNIDNTGTTLRFGIESSSDWNIDNHNTWYTATKVTHDNGDSLVITVQTNIARQKRSGEMTLSNKDKRPLPSTRPRLPKNIISNSRSSSMSCTRMPPTPTKTYRHGIYSKSSMT